jgi:molybdopterin-guanine dinucleotide biosynthesis adapter protein
MAVPIISIVGTSDSGKTTLLEKLISSLVEKGFRVGTVKHDVHGFEMDREGKDSWRHKKAGASTTVISSPRQVGMVKDVASELTLDEIAERFFYDVDIVLVEGYKREPKTKIEVHRKILGRELLSTKADGLIAVMSDEPLEVEVPCFDINDIASLSGLLLSFIQVNRH